MSEGCLRLFPLKTINTKWSFHILLSEQLNSNGHVLVYWGWARLISNGFSLRQRPLWRWVQELRDGSAVAPHTPTHKHVWKEQSMIRMQAVQTRGWLELNEEKMRRLGQEWKNPASGKDGVWNWSKEVRRLGERNNELGPGVKNGLPK